MLTIHSWAPYKHTYTVRSMLGLSKNTDWKRGSLLKFRVDKTDSQGNGAIIGHGYLWIGPQFARMRWRGHSWTFERGLENPWPMIHAVINRSPEQKG